MGTTGKRIIDTPDGANPSDVLAALTTLEICGLIRSLPGGRYERAD